MNVPLWTSPLNNFLLKWNKIIIVLAKNISAACFSQYGINWLYIELIFGKTSWSDKKNAPRFSFTPKNLINAAVLHIFGRNEKLKNKFSEFFTYFNTSSILWLLYFSRPAKLNNNVCWNYKGMNIYWYASHIKILLTDMM